MPVYCRISINTEKIAFSTKQRICPKVWEQKTGRAKGKTQAACQANVMLDSMRNQINARYDEYLKDGETPSPEMLRNDLLGLNAANDTLLTVFADFNERHERSIGIEIAQSTFNKYDLTYRRLQEFLQEKYKVADIRQKKINLDFIMAFESFLRVDHCMTNNSAEKLIRIFKRIVGIARGNGLIQSDPFTNYRIRVKRTRREFLTMEEVETIMRKRFDCERLRKVKDIFVFCCFTGFAFADVSALTNGHIKKRSLANYNTAIGRPFTKQMLSIDRIFEDNGLVMIEGTLSSCKHSVTTMISVSLTKAVEASFFSK